MSFGPLGRKRKEGEKDEEAITPLWLITFTDVMALMLTFFVLLYSMSVPEEEKWVEVTSALNSEFNKFFNQTFEAGPSDDISIDKIDQTSALDLSYLKNLMTQLLSEDEALKGAILIQQKEELIISMPSDLLFEAGQAEVKEKGRRALFGLGGALSRIKNRIEIIGHADPRPVQASGGTYSSNWQLSLARSLQVASVLENVGYRRPITVRGLSSARYEDLPDNLDENTRLDLARRVDIVIMKDDGGRGMFLNFGQ